MWFLTTSEDRLLTERDMLWPDVPEDVRIRELGYIPRSGFAYRLRDCDVYGFQRYRLDAPEGLVGQGAQIIGVKGNEAIVVEFNEVTGERRQWTLAKDQLTYAPGLLRHGMG